MHRPSTIVQRALPACLLLSLITLSVRHVCAQTPSVKQLDQDAERARLEYLQQLGKLADQYDQAGETDRAKKVLRQILELAPGVEEVQTRLNELEERVFVEQTLEVEVDVSKSWVSTGLLVEQDKPIRLEAEGKYKFIVNGTLGPDGYATTDLDHELVPGINIGALMGLVVTQPKSTEREKPKPGTPFLIGSKSETTPSTSGLLYLRMNVPTGTKSNGTIKVKVSGHVQRATPSP